jgi:hypothetical protein
MAVFVPPGPLTTPVLFIAFKRYEASKAVMEAIRTARPPRLYFACDGPRNEAERADCDLVRSLTALVDWPCELHTRFSETNQSVKFGPPAALDWFFGQEEEGIVLEDDCRPAQSFFWFCQELLERYRHDERIWIVIGNNLMTEWAVTGQDSYYFSNHGYGAYWGWASWRRMWQQYDLHMRQWPALRDSGLLDGHYLTRGEMRQANSLLEQSWNGRIHSWDFQLDFGRIANGALNIIPNTNLVRNIGFGDHSTHTMSERDPRNKENLQELQFPLRHPRFFLVDAERDLAYFSRYIEPNRFRRFKDAIKGLLPGGLDKALTPHLSRWQKRLGLN